MTNFSADWLDQQLAKTRQIQQLYILAEYLPKYRELKPEHLCWAESITGSLADSADPALINERARRMRDMLTLAVEECFELAKYIPRKPWKAEPNCINDPQLRAEAKLELADAFAFLFAICTYGDISPEELAEAIATKREVCHGRLAGLYANFGENYDYWLSQTKVEPNA